MSRNQKLAPLLAGRTIAAIEPPAPAAPTTTPTSAFAPSPGTTWHVRFSDGSTLAVRTDGTGPAGADQAPTGPVADVTQHGTTLALAFGPAAGANAGGTAGGNAAVADPTPAAPLVFQTAELAACVMLRDPQGRMTYAD